MASSTVQAYSEEHAKALASFDARLRESERFHLGIGKVHQTLQAIARDLEAAGIDYAIVGGMALNAHGYRRETVDVNVLVTPEGLAAFASRLVGGGYRPACEGARKTFRHTETNVKIKFLITGEYPGDGEPKPVPFPNPADVSTVREDRRFINLPALMTLKLASGMTNPARLRDLADVQELIRILDLDERAATELHPYVRDRFLELLDAVRSDERQEE